MRLLSVGLDVEDLEVARRITRPIRPLDECSSLCCWLHVAVGSRGSSSGCGGRGATRSRSRPVPDRLVAAVHGDEVDVHVDEQVRLGRAAVDRDHLALVGRAEQRHAVRILGVVVVVAVRVERVEDFSPTMRFISASVIRRCSALAMIRWTSSTPASAGSSSTISMTVGGRPGASSAGAAARCRRTRS